jgi:hypothetical protein
MAILIISMKFYDMTGDLINDRNPAAKGALVIQVLIQKISNSSFCNTKTLSIPVISALRPVKRKFLQNTLVQTRKRSVSLKSVNLFQDVSFEQAEVGQSPTLLAICAANGVLRILRGYFTAFLPAKKKNTGYLAVSCIDI